MIDLKGVPVSCDARPLTLEMCETVISCSIKQLPCKWTLDTPVITSLYKVSKKWVRYMKYRKWISQRMLNKRKFAK